MAEEQEKKVRLMSLDILRGFDMFFIMGGELLVVALCTVFGCADSFVARNMEHVAWTGLHFYDTVFPLFLFLAGVSWPFSLASQQKRGRTAWQIHRKILTRMIHLFLIGIAYNCATFWRFGPEFRIPSVLGHIGIGWGVAALVFMHVKKGWARFAIGASVPLAYWAVCLAWGAHIGADPYTQADNVFWHLDRLVMPTHVWMKGKGDPETLFVALGGVPLAMMGMFAGETLRRGIEPLRKMFTLVMAGVGAFLLGLVFLYVFRIPCIKALWTGSFVCFAGTYAFFVMALFYWIVDIRGWRKWGFFFQMIGLNSITIYLAQSVIDFGKLREICFGGLIRPLAYWSADWGTVANHAGFIAVCWLFLYLLHRNRIYLKV